MPNLRVMSFNLAGGYDEHEPENAWITSGRSALACEVISDASPDVIGFQEVQWPNFATLGETLSRYDSFQGPHADEPPYLFNPIFWCRERLQPLSKGGFWISDTPEHYSSSWASAGVRVATWVRFREVATSMTMLHVNAHIDHISEDARIEGADLLNWWITATAQPDELQLLTGDFNCNPWRPEVEEEAGRGCTFTDAIHRFLLDEGFVDSFLSSGLQDGQESNSYHGYEGAGYDLRRHHLAWRPDWILFRCSGLGIDVDKSKILRHHKGSLYPSDHYPVVSDLNWK